MKKKKVIIGVLISLISLLIIGAVVFGIVTVVKKSEDARKERLAKEKEITDNFETIKENAIAFSDTSVDYRTWVKNDISEDTIHHYDEWVAEIDNMTSNIDEMNKVADIYKKNCINQHYSNENVQTMCDSFMDAYERAVNTYVTDVTDFNQKIKELAEKTKKEELKEYELKVEKVDLNNDGNFAEIEMEASAAPTEDQ